MRVTEQGTIRALLERDREWAVYALGDLAPERFRHCEWFAATGEPGAIALVYRAFDTPVLLTVGEAEAIGGLLEEIGDLPAMYLSIRPEVLPLIRARYEVEWERAMWRMVLDPARFCPAPTERCVRLGSGDVGALTELYADGGETHEAPDFFAPAMLEEGVFYGIREEGRLPAAAGTHLVTPGEGVAAIGNIYTRRDRRRRGLGRQVTSAVTEELRAGGIGIIALNVAQSNAAAVGLYEGLGFVRHCAFYEGLARRGRPSLPLCQRESEQAPTSTEDSPRFCR